MEADLRLCRGLALEGQSRILVEPATNRIRSSAKKYPTTLFVGLDVRKDTIGVAHVVEDRSLEITFVGPIGTCQRAIDRLVRRLLSKASRLIFAHEAGPCGYGLYRCLARKGLTCLSSLPRSFRRGPQPVVRRQH